ncbi:DNA polymerase-3 subunit epsilon [Mesonia phycicola]|uniref:Excinuclease cho n=1 Tax=Mesonia phycicola TaxID=579105 RepID=A0A1M6FJP9_9FLAO|nr:exonuclease domain-containing protein [Mesonia phycicola]SHI97960.1 DNA polymerase-3 subunit epsilon [Mesonia phycicola]
MYAILDIETTGGKYNEEGITEIAIYKFDGHEVVDQFISLVNPEIPIQPFVVGLTGINNEMLRNAPKFFEVAKRIVEITSDCTLVAHNAKFDYRILRLEFRRLGYEFQRKSLCTVELSKKLIPNMPSYSLGKLVKNLGIPITDRHRASGDAIATVKLFKLLLQKDSSKEIIKHSISSNPKLQMESKLIHIIDELPAIVGVYYMYNQAGNIIYIGKSKNIKKRVNQHFTNSSHKSKKIQQEVSVVTFESTGNELLALLKENEEIKKNKPKYNRALIKDIFSHALYTDKDKNNYVQFKIGKADPEKENITTFTNLNQAKSILEKIVEEFKLCQKHTGLHKTSGSCFNYSIKECYGACVTEESAEDYNKRAQQVINKYSYENKNMLVIDRGREVDEKSVILIEDGKFKGIGYYNLNFQVNHIETVKNIITPMQNNRDSQHIIQSYLRRKKPLKIVEF